MALSLIDCSVHGQQRVRYLICVNWFAFIYLSSLDHDDQRLKTSKMEQYLDTSRLRYRDNTLFAVHHLEIDASPDVSLLQALLSGVRLPSFKNQVYSNRD